MNFQTIHDLDQQYYMNTFGERLPVAFVSGEGCTLTDTEGKTYVDFFGGIAVNALGYGYPSFMAAMHDQLDKLLHTSSVYYVPNQALLAQQLVEHTFADRVFMANTGTEANEGAIKLARRYFKDKDPRRFKVLSLVNSFHGRTLATLAATGQEKYQKPYTPLPEGFENARFVSVDTASPSQLGALYELYGDRVSLMIDHHEAGTPYADHLIVPNAAACGEIVYDLIAASGKEAPSICDSLLYAAISGDTGGFRFSNVTRETHLRAAALVESGVDVAQISHKLFSVKSFPVLRAERLGFDKLHLYDKGRIGISAISFEDKQFNKLQDEHLSTIVDIVRSIEGVEIAVVIRQIEKERAFRVSMRANVDFDVSAVCAKFGGGGHRRAAGATVEAKDVEEAERLVLDAICK